MLAEFTGLESAGVIGGLVFGGAGSLVAVIALFKKSGTEVSPQPLNVEIVKALHEQFANQDDFEALVAANTERHAQLFRRIETVERDARAALTDEIAKINADRQRTMEKLNDQFTFIRESLSAINTELKLKREGKS
jgi:hypothetical protein